MAPAPVEVSFFFNLGNLFVYLRCCNFKCRLPFSFSGREDAIWRDSEKMSAVKFRDKADGHTVILH